MPRIRKFRKGPPILDPVAALSMLIGGRWFYWQGRPKSPIFLMNMPVEVIRRAAEMGHLCLAVANEDLNQ